MQTTINNNLLARLKPQAKPYDVRDNKLTGFILRVNITGKLVYMCEYARGKRMMIGKAGVLTPAQARDRAKEILADAVKGVDPTHAKKASKALTLQKYLNSEYSPWIKAHRKSGVSTIKRIETHFLSEFGNKTLAEITSLAIEKWKTKRLQAGKKATTVNRDIASLKAMLSKAVEWGFIEIHPLAKLKLEKVDNAAKVRYLTQDEELRLREAIDVREEKLRVARVSANEWRRERGYDEMPDLCSQTFADYMKPMILLTLNSGLRRGELFSLTWDNVNFAIATLSVVGGLAKSKTTRHMPLNSEALSVLKAWRKQTNGTGLVFTNKDDKRITDIKKSWATILKLAKIKKFRWHDQRHHFASRLVMAGVDLNTVRELLGHSDIKMTLRYAHLAPEHKAEAVARLVSSTNFSSNKQQVAAS